MHLSTNNIESKKALRIRRGQRTYRRGVATSDAYLPENEGDDGEVFDNNNGGDAFDADNREMLYFPIGVLPGEEASFGADEMDANADFNGVRVPWNMLLATKNAADIAMSRGVPLIFDVLGTGRIFKASESIREAKKIIEKSSSKSHKAEFVRKIVDLENIRASYTRAILSVLGLQGDVSSFTNELITNPNENDVFFTTAIELEKALSSQHADVPWYGDVPLRFSDTIRSVLPQMRSSGDQGQEDITPFDESDLRYPIADISYFASVVSKKGDMIVARGGDIRKKIVGKPRDTECLKKAAVGKLTQLRAKAGCIEAQDLAARWHVLDALNGSAIYQSTGSAVPVAATYYLTPDEVNNLSSSKPFKMQFSPFISEQWDNLMTGAENAGVVMKPESFRKEVVAPFDLFLKRLVESGKSEDVFKVGGVSFEAISEWTQTPQEDRALYPGGSPSNFVSLLREFSKRVHAAAKADYSVYSDAK